MGGADTGATPDAAWTHVLDGTASGDDFAYSAASAPDGATVFIAGMTHARDTYFDVLLAAVDADTGAFRWAATHDGPDRLADRGDAVAVTPDGRLAIVAGHVTSGGDEVLAVVAFDAATGERVWSMHDPSSPVRGGAARAHAAVTPDGSRVVVATDLAGAARDVLVVAFDAATGARAWSHVFDDGGVDRQFALAVAPDSSRVLVALQTERSSLDLGVLALDASTGERDWLAHYDGAAGREDVAVAVAVSADGSRVVATGASDGGGAFDVPVVAFDASTGALQWSSRLAGPSATGNSVHVTPDGSRVLVSGFARNGGVDRDVLAAALFAENGTVAWEDRWDGPLGGTDGANAGVLAADGARYVVAGVTYNGGYWDFAALAFDVASGAREWVGLWAPGPNSVAYAAVASGSGSRVHAVGFSELERSGNDAAAVAFDVATGDLAHAARFDGARNAEDRAQALATTPDGALVLTAAWSKGRGSLKDAVVTAVTADAGALAWQHRYDGPDAHDDEPRALAVTPDGARVLVAVTSARAASGQDAVLVALDAATGARAWAVDVDAGADEDVVGLALSPDGSRAFMNILKREGGAARAIVTVAVDAATGLELWRDESVAPDGGRIHPGGIAVTLSGARVAVAATVGSDEDADVLVRGLDAATGLEEWASVVDASCGGFDAAHGIVASVDGDAVFLVGASDVVPVAGAPCNPATHALQRGIAAMCDEPLSWFVCWAAPGSDARDLLVLRVDADDGRVAWSTRVEGGPLDARPTATVAPFPDGLRVAVAALVAPPDGSALEDQLALALDVERGAVLWTARESGESGSFLASMGVKPILAVAPDGARVLVASSVRADELYDYGLFAYDALTGVRTWSARFDGAATSGDWVFGMALDAAGSRAFVTGGSDTGPYWREGEDAVTIAWDLPDA